MKRIVAMGTAACLIAAGCAQFYRPEVDLGGADRAKYEADLAECRKMSEQATEEGPTIAVGTLLGLLLGLGIGAATSNNTIFMKRDNRPLVGLAIGSAVGALLSGMLVASKNARSIDGCLRSRGYAVRV